MIEPNAESWDPDSLVEAVLGGEDGAWERLVGFWSRRVYAAARSRLHDPEAAEEVTQSVMVTAYQHISSGRYTHTGRFESWLFRIAMNRVRDAVRRSARSRHVALGAPPATEAPSPTSGDPRSVERLRAAVATLPDADQEVLSLRHQAGLSFAVIAELLNQPMGTVLARHHRALGKLRTLLDPEPSALETHDGP